MLLNFNTDEVPEKDAGRYWEDSLKRAFFLDHAQVKPVSGQAFRASLRFHKLEDGFRVGDLRLGACKLVFREDPAKDFVILGFPVAGGEVIRHGRKSHTYAPGEVMVLNDMTHKHSEVACDGVRRLMVCVPRTALEKRFARVNDFGFAGIHIMPPGPQVELLSRAAHMLAKRVEMAEGVLGPAVTLAETAFLQRLDDALHALPDSRGDPRHKLRTFHRERIKSYALSNLHAELHIGVIAAAVNLSESYVYNLFAAEPLSLMRWIWLQRLERCRHELENGEPGRSIRDVAYAWGFNDAAHFSHMFHEKYGVPPREYRIQRQLARGVSE